MFHGRNSNVSPRFILLLKVETSASPSRVNSLSVVFVQLTGKFHASYRETNISLPRCPSISPPDVSPPWTKKPDRIHRGIWHYRIKSRQNSKCAVSFSSCRKISLYMYDKQFANCLQVVSFYCSWTALICFQLALVRRVMKRVWNLGVSLPWNVSGDRSALIK